MLDKELVIGIAGAVIPIEVTRVISIGSIGSYYGHIGVRPRLLQTGLQYLTYKYLVL